ncbi:hypothetical protein [Tychonema sp. LEGE 07203]|uniref:hypothetical protein n=1 Tax=Tychonema sp. LEGE 07203 TaxID=1828671 RepID=UPI00187ED37E|nr:hypothetical protein [Tychonema sp. LEGE 07203]MBE9097748.1 hypothetical protein [Tychonema sp. LEGE 07203]
MVNRRSVDFCIEYWGIEDLLAGLNQGTRSRVENLRLHPQERQGDRQYPFLGRSTFRAQKTAAN